MSHKFISAVVALIFRQGRVLAMRRAAHKPGAGKWEAVSGRMEHGEQPLDAVRREIVEETGLEVELEQRPLWSYTTERDGDDMLVLVYRADHRAGEVTRSHEHDDHEWLTPDEFAQRTPFALLAEAVYRAARS